jgi:hypothetical protein
MSILNTVISISLILISAAKTADLFIASDKALTHLQKDFIEHTKKLHQNEKGNVSLTGAVFTALLSALLFFYVAKMQLEFKEAVYRKESYLCFHYLNVETQKYVKEMAGFNWGLRAAFASKNTVVNGVSGEVIFRALVMARNARHFFYLKKLAQNKYCHVPETLPYLKTTPFQIGMAGALTTNIDETTIARNNQWSLVLFKNPHGIRLRKAFCLKSEFQMQNTFAPNLQLKTQELDAKDLSSLKCFSGSS